MYDGAIANIANNIVNQTLSYISELYLLTINLSGLCGVESQPGLDNLSDLKYQSNLGTVGENGHNF